MVQWTSREVPHARLLDRSEMQVRGNEALQPRCKLQHGISDKRGLRAKARQRTGREAGAASAAASIEARPRAFYLG